MAKIFEGRNIYKMYNVSRIKRLIYSGNFFSPSTRKASLQDIVMQAHLMPHSYYSKGILVADKPSGFKFRYGIE